MLGSSSKPIPFDPYGSRRRSRRFPRWLLLLIFGAALGAGGVVLVQERYLPPRLSHGESTRLQADYQAADAERARLKTQLDDTSRRLQAALGDKQKADTGLQTAGAEIEKMRTDLNALIALLPPDPRGGGVEVRAGTIEAKGGRLAYDVVLTRARATAAPMAGVMQLVVAGENARGTETAVTLAPVSLSIGGHEIVRGSLPLPEGFRPRQTTIQILDRVGGKRLGMRVLLVG